MGNQNEVLSTSIHKQILQGVIKGKGTELLFIPPPTVSKLKALLELKVY